MSANKDLRTTGIVLRRTNYGEADRILNILTPEGKISVMAKGVRKAKSKLAGGVEMFCLSDIVVHQGKSGLGILTSAKMIKYYQNIIKDLNRLELASNILKTLSKVADEVDNAEYFDLLKQALSGLDSKLDLRLVKFWFELNFNKLNGEEFNLYVDTNNEKLSPEIKYSWDQNENALRPNQNGSIAGDEIKLARLMVSSSLFLVSRVQDVDILLANIFKSL